MRSIFIIISIFISELSLSQRHFETIVKSGYFDSIPSCEGLYFIQTTPLLDSIYISEENHFIEKSEGALSILEYTDNCTDFFKLEQYILNDKKVQIRLIKLKHIKSSANSSRSIVVYWVDFTVKRKKSQWVIVRHKKYLNR